MEEILASIRRIIADDEAKPTAAEKPAIAAAPPPKADPPPAPAKAASDKAASAKAAAPSPPPAPAAKAAAAPAPKPPAPPPAPAASNNQDDIDSLLASLDEATPASEIRPPQPDGDVFELTDDMALPDPAPAPAAAPSFRKVEPQDDVEFTESIAAKALNRQPAYEPPPIETAPVPPIISGTTMRAVESAFNSLANTVLSNNARTLEDLVKEMLRPMLKNWLDDNLPGLVERIVKAEIERVSRGR